ncbi:hypothetical protein, partial [Pantoea sp. C2G6]|uniref:hypothetical protein n=1 Tax=Pantoea sp. C2G6 TaxID=3243084 RepID=UPI003ED9442D
KPNPLMSWKGQLIYAASDNVMVYIERFPMMSDRDMNSGVFLSYEMNGVHGKIYVSSDSDPGIDITLLITDSALFIKAPGSQNMLYRLPAENMNSFSVSEDNPGSAEGNIWPHIMTPSGDTRFTCDYSVRPAKFDVTPEQVYASDATGVPVHGQ